MLALAWLLTEAGVYIGRWEAWERRDTNGRNEWFVFFRLHYLQETRLETRLDVDFPTWIRGIIYVWCLLTWNTFGSMCIQGPT